MKQYLLSATESPCFIDLKHADAYAGAICVTYLSFPELTKQVARQPATFAGPRDTEIVSSVVTNVMPLGKTANQLALRFLKSRDKHGKSVDRLMKDALTASELQSSTLRTEKNIFLPYAEPYRLDQTKHELDFKSSKQTDDYKQLDDKGDQQNILQQLEWTASDLRTHPSTVLSWAVKENHYPLIRLALMLGAVIRAEDIEALGALTDVTNDAHRFEDICSLLGPLLPFKVPRPAHHQTRLYTILSLSLRSSAVRGDASGLKASLARLGDRGPDVKFDLGRTALHLAALNSHTAIARLMLDGGSTVDCRDRQDRTPLMFAADKDATEVIALLMKHHANIDAQDHEKRAPVHHAARSGAARAMKLLLAHDAQMELQDNSGRTALSLAASEGHLGLVSCIPRGMHNGTRHAYMAWKAGSQGRYIGDVRDTQGKLPIHYAAFNGHADIVKSLRHYSIEPDSSLSRHLSHETLLAQDKDGKLAIHYAAMNDHLATVEALLNIMPAKDLTADVEEDKTLLVQDSQGMLALHYAAMHGHATVVEAIVQRAPRGVLDAKNKEEKTAFTMAVEHKHARVLEILVKAGITEVSPYDFNRAVNLALGSARWKLHKLLLKEYQKWCGEVPPPSPPWEEML